MSNALELFAACYFEYDGTHHTDTHLHENAYQLYYVADGEVQYLYCSEWLNLTKGQFLLVAPNIVHGMKNNGPSNVLDIKFYIYSKSLRTNVDEKLPFLRWLFI